MAEIRVAKIIHTILLWYLRLMVPMFAIFCCFVLYLFFMSENWNELCHTVYLSEPHDFAIDEKYGCRIDWAYVFREGVSILSYIGFWVLVLPFMFKKILERLK